MYSEARISPGMRPAISIWPMETCAVTAYTMVSTDGGMRMPSVPDAQMVPSASSGL